MVWAAAGDSWTKVVPLSAAAAGIACARYAAGSFASGWGSWLDIDEDCADVVVYTSTMGEALGFRTRFLAHMGNYPELKVRSFVGSSDLDDARACCLEVFLANVAYNAATGTSRYPTNETDHRPLLVILGDSYPSIVDHLRGPDEHGRCCAITGPENCCVVDREVWDFDFLEGPPFGMVHRVPANSLVECDRACTAADQWNDPSGAYVDPFCRSILMVGDYSNDTEIRPEATTVALETAYSMTAYGYPPHDFLLESDYNPWQGPPNLNAKHVALRNLLQSGVRVLWGFGFRASAAHWPGAFLPPPDPAYPTPMQRLIAIQPCCHTVDCASTDPNAVPFAEAWLFNDPDETVIAATLGHASGGYYRQHAEAAMLYLDGWLTYSTYPEERQAFPLDRIAVYALEEAHAQQLPVMEEYFNSAYTVGAYVMMHAGGSAPGQVFSGSGTPWLKGSDRPLALEWLRGPNGVVRLRASSPRTSQATLKVMDPLGRVIATLLDGTLRKGDSFLTWLGKDSAGLSAPSGVYYAYLESESGEHATAKVLHVR